MKRAEVNWQPGSVVIDASDPKRAIQMLIVVDAIFHVRYTAGGLAGNFRSQRAAMRNTVHGGRAWLAGISGASDPPLAVVENGIDLAGTFSHAGECVIFFSCLLDVLVRVCFFFFIPDESFCAFISGHLTQNGKVCICTDILNFGSLLGNVRPARRRFSVGYVAYLLYGRLSATAESKHRRIQPPSRAQYSSSSFSAIRVCLATATVVPP